MAGDGKGLFATVRQDAAEFGVTAFLGNQDEIELMQDGDDVIAGEDL
jgi:hypothetical protein